MKSVLKSCVLSLALCSFCFTPTATSQTKRFDLDTAAKLVRLSDPNLAPDGKSIVVVVARANYEDNRWENELVLVDVATGAQRALTSGRHDVAQPRWSSSGDRLAFALLLTSATFVTDQAQSEKPEAEIQQVQQAAEKFVAAFNHLDWERFQACWAADATIFHPFADLPRRLQGREEIVASFKQRFDNLKKQNPKPPYLNIQPKDLEVSLLGSAALVTFHLGGETTQGRRTLVFQKRGGAWLIVHLHASNLTLPTGEKK